MATVSLAPFPPPRQAPAATAWSIALALGMHGLLFAFLYFGVRWQSRPPAAIEAELWREPARVLVPAPVQTAPLAAPRPLVREEPRPEAAPAKPDIAIKEEKKPPPRKEEKPKPEVRREEKPPPRKEEKPKPEVRREEKPPPNDDPIKAALAREEISKAVERETVASKAARDSAALAAAQGARAQAEWADRVRNVVRRRVPLTVASAVSGNPEAIFEVNLLPGHEVGSVRRVRSSGNAAYDEAAERAIMASSPLPPAPAGVAIDRLLILKMRPKEE